MTDHLRYRPEIDGLRALAVLAVVLFHADFGLPGGYVGVDVFFVISGCLITALIVRDLRAGAFSLAEFFERRIRRIAPAMIALVLGVLAAGWFLFLPWGYADLARSAIAVVAMLANVFFWRTTSGYFSPSVHEMPLLHTWSLAVEEQFYLVVPLLLMGLFAFPRLRSPRLLLILAVGFLLASLAFSALAVAKIPGVAFFFLPSRAWELLLGATVALLPAGFPAPARIWREILGYAGLAGIVVPFFLYSAATPFPGLAAVPPCLGTALVIFSARAASGESTSLARLLSLRPLVFVGLISYSLYLWHWPPLAFCRYWSDGPLSAEVRAGLVGLAFVLAVISWRFVETPFRRRALFARRRPLFVFAVVSFAILAGLAGFVVKTDGFPDRLPAQVVTYAAAESDRPPQYHRKADDIRRDDLPRFGATNRPPSVLLWGDSQAYCLLPAFDEAAKALGLAGVAITHGARAPALGGFSGGDFGRDADLAAWTDETLKYVAAHDIKDTFLAGFWQDYYDQKGFPAALAKTIRALRAAGTRVWIVRQIPSHPQPVPKDLARSVLFHTDDAWKRTTPARYLGQAAVMTRLAETPAGSEVRFLDPAPFFHDSATGTYRVDLDGRSLYYDQIHLTETTSRTLMARWLLDQLRGQL